MLEMVIDSIRVSLMNYQRVVILKERLSDRYLPIWIGSPEADAIAVKLQDVSVPRPLTHDLLGSVITELGAVADHVVVSDLTNDTFYAKLVLNLTDGGQKAVDCRPSDAIAIAVRGGCFVVGPDRDRNDFLSVTEAQQYVEKVKEARPDFEGLIESTVPILVEDGVLEKAGITMDRDSGKPAVEGSQRGRERGTTAPPAVTEEEAQRMSAFSEFLKDLPGLEELGGKPSDS